MSTQEPTPGTHIQTDVGLTKHRDAILNGGKVTIAAMALGNGDGSLYEPTSSMTALKGEFARQDITNQSPLGDKAILTRTIFPQDIPFDTVREIGFFDDEGDLIFIYAGEAFQAFATGGAEHEVEHTLLLDQFAGDAVIIDAPIDGTDLVDKINQAGGVNASKLGGKRPSEFATPNDITKYQPTMSENDFVNGTLITTSVDFVSGGYSAVTLEVKGRSHNAFNAPINFELQSYVHDGAFTLLNGIDYSGNLGMPPITILNLDGKIAYWWPRLAFWNSFTPKVYKTGGGASYENAVTSIQDVALPDTAQNPVEVPLIKSLTTENFDGLKDSLLSPPTLKYRDVTADRTHNHWYQNTNDHDIYAFIRTTTPGGQAYVKENPTDDPVIAGHDDGDSGTWATAFFIVPKGAYYMTNRGVLNWSEVS
ncbi:MAG: phage tail-collar fiber domain-containing protein [Planktomarina sp.]